LDRSAGKQITNFRTERITDLQWFFDGSKLGIVRGHTDLDTLILKQAKAGARRRFPQPSTARNLSIVTDNLD